jgi:hypothetical protein
MTLGKLGYCAVTKATPSHRLNRYECGENKG